MVETRLENGLKLLICPRPGTGVVAVALWVRVGYLDEADREVGLSHVLEHMYFKGTRERPDPEGMAREIKGLGGQLNAGTYYDATYYYVVLPAASLSRALEIQADALLYPRFDTKDLQTEIEAVIQEARRKKDNSSAFAYEKTYELAFQKHRIRRWRIGEEAHLRSFRRKDLVAFHRKFYSADRVIVSVVGDCEPRRVRAQARKLFSPLKRNPIRFHPGPREPVQDRFRRRRLRGDLGSAHLVYLFHTPEFFHDDAFPLRILTTLLGSGRSSRLFQGIREQKRLVDSIGASLEAVRDVGFLTLSAETDVRRLEKAERQILLEVARIREGISDDELDRSRTNMERRYFGNQSDVLGLALNLASFEALGSYRLAQDYFRKLFAVKKRDIARVAEKYLHPSNCSLLEYLPEKTPAPNFRNPWRTIGKPDPVSRRPIADGAAAPAIRFSRGSSSPRRLPPVRSQMIDPGIKFLFQEDRSLPLVSLEMLLPGGKAREDRNSNGLTALLQSTMLKGSRNWRGQKLAAELERIGVVLAREIGDDYFGFSLQCLSRTLPEALKIFFDLLLNPELSSGEISKEKKNQISAIRRTRDQSFPAAFRLFREIAFPGDNYSLSVLGTPGSVSRIDENRVRRWHRSSLRPQGAVVAAVGDFDRKILLRALRAWGDHFNGIPVRQSMPGPGLSLKLARSAPRIRSVRRRRHQTAQVIGFPVSRLAHPDRHALIVLQSITSGLGGRFFEEIRSRRGLAYTVASVPFLLRRAGTFVVYMATSPEHENEARQVLFHEVDRLRREGPTPGEVARAIQYIKGGYAVAHQTNGARAEALAEAEVLGLGFREMEKYPARIAAVTPEDVHRVTRKYLDPEFAKIGVVRGMKGI